jgi:hypothetical protein
LSAHGCLTFVRCSQGCLIAAEIIAIRRRQRGLYEWRMLPISRRVVGLTSAPCRSWRCKSRRAPWAGWFWSTRLARSRSGKSYEVTGLCILNLWFRSKTHRHLDKTRFSSMALDICVSPVGSAASAVLIVIHRVRFRRFSVARWECFFCFRGMRDGAGRILWMVVVRVVCSGSRKDQVDKVANTLARSRAAQNEWNADRNLAECPFRAVRSTRPGSALRAQW